MKNPNETKINDNSIGNLGENKSSLYKINSSEKSKENFGKIFDLKNEVKSQYILKKIFLILSDKKKLFLTRYNRFYHELLGINIEYYKNISGKLRLMGKNGFGKELKLSSFDLLYKGYFLNGKKDGYGKEYKGNVLIFEGEYKNGKRNGKGIEYSPENKIVFEGEYKEGKYWKGKIKKYDRDTEKYCFEGQYLNGIKTGKEYFNNGNILFEGEYLDDKRWSGKFYNKENDCFSQIKNGNGKVKEYYDYGDLKFEGEYLNGEMWNGTLKDYSLTIIYKRGHGCHCCEKMFFKNKEVYKKVKEYKNILEYEGEYSYGKRNGKGKEYDINGNLIYEGDFCDGYRKTNKVNEDNLTSLNSEISLKNGVKNGITKYYNRKGEIVYQAEYKNDIIISEEDECDNEHGLKFEGEFLNGKYWNGKFKEYENGYLKCEGEFINGRKIGKEYEYSGKLIFEGEFFETKKVGKEYDKNGDLIFEGELIYSGIGNGRDIYWNGKGKEFDCDDNLFYEGDYLEGKIYNGIIYDSYKKEKYPIKNGNGKVKEYNNKGQIIFDGEY